jgi:hypothetical protein
MMDDASGWRELRDVPRPRDEELRVQNLRLEQVGLTTRLRMLDAALGVVSATAHLAAVTEEVLRDYRDDVAARMAEPEEPEGTRHDVRRTRQRIQIDE